MAQNKMKEVAKLLGVEMDKPFNIKTLSNNPFKIIQFGLVDTYKTLRHSTLSELLAGELEIEQPILDDVEKRYLEGVLRPFKDKVEFIKKDQNDYGQWISIELKEDWFCLPYYEIDKMYKGMELDKEYTLQELGLFEDD